MDWLGAWSDTCMHFCALLAGLARARYGHAALFFPSRLCLWTRAWRVGMRFLLPLALIAAFSRAPLCAADDDHFARRADYDRLYVP